MFLIIGIWGSSIRRIHASYLLFYYTFLGSIFMLFALLVIKDYIGSLNFNIIKNNYIPVEIEKLLWIFLFISFSIKVPLVPFHIWLPEAHVEAPTVGSVMLAGVLLKLGTYGFLKILIPLFPKACIEYKNFIFSLCTIGAIYSSLTTLRQIDIKKIIAYSSIVHMNFLILALFCLNIESFSGAFLTMLTHGIISGGMFFLIGCLYDRYHTRIVKYFGGLNLMMPYFSFVFFLIILSNISIPGTVSFIGELLMILAFLKQNSFILIISSISLIITTIFSIWLFIKIFYGPLNLKFLKKFKDFDIFENLIFSIIIFIIFFFGIYPFIYFYTTDFYYYMIIENLYKI
jgi:proton-translocating NADH-quinone oxidoreductase chain M